MVCWKSDTDKFDWMETAWNQNEKNQKDYKNHNAIFEKDIGHTVGAVSRYDQEYLKYYLPDVNVEVSLGFILLYFIIFLYK